MEGGFCEPLPYTPYKLAGSEAENISEEERRVLSSLSFESQMHAIQKLREFIELIKRSVERGLRQSRVLIIRGPWGYGKTFLGREVLEKLSHKYGLAYRYVTFEDIIRGVIEEYKESMGSQPGATPNLTILAEAVINRVLEEALKEAVRSGKPGTVLFIDEIEAFLAARSSRRDLYSLAAGTAIDSLLNIIKHLMHSESSYYSEFRGRVHIVMATTPEAYYTLLTLTEERGVAGRLKRRWEIVTLRPISKLDMYRLIDEIIERIYRIPNWLKERNLVNLVYVLSNGNPGIAIKILNSVVSAATNYCKFVGGECVCRATDRFLINVLPSREVETLEGGGTQLMDEQIARRILELYKGSYEGLYGLTPDAVELIIKLVTTAAPVEVSNPAILYQLENALAMVLRLGFYKVDLYIGSEEDVAAWLRESARVLASQLGVDLVLARTALEMLVYRASGDQYMVALPEADDDYSEVQQILASQDVMVSREHVRKLIVNARRIFREQRRGISLRTASLAMLYPAANLRIIPFVRDPNKARELLRDVERIRSVDPNEYYRLIANAFSEALIAANLAERQEHSIYAVLQYGRDEYLVPLRIYVNEEPPRSELEPELRIVLRYLGSSLTERPATRTWNTIEVPLTYTDFQLMAVAGLISTKSGFREYVDEMLLQGVYQQLVSKYRIEELFSAAAREAAEKGVLIPSTIEGAEIIAPESGRQDPVIFLRDAYNLMLIGGRHGRLDLGQLVELLVNLYRARPYKRGEKWCDIRVPVFLSIDLEPENPRDLYSRVEKYRDWLLAKLRIFAQAAAKSSLLETEGGDTYLIKLHPVERRILYILSKLPGREIDLPSLKGQYLLLPRGTGMYAATRILDDFFIEILKRRLEILKVEERKAKGRKTVLIKLIDRRTRDRLRNSSIRSLKDSLDSLIKEVQRIEQIIDRAKQKVPGETSESLLELGYGSLMSIIMAKEKGVKIITPDSLLKAAEDIRAVAEVADPALQNLIEYNNYLQDITDLMRAIIDSVNRFVEERETKVKELKAKVHSIVDIVKRTLGISVNQRVYVSETDVYECLLSAVKQADALVGEITTKPLRELKKKYQDLLNTVRYDNCVNEYRFSPLLYALKNCEECRQLDRKLNDLERILDEAERLAKDITRTLEGLPRHTRDSVLKALRTRFSRIGTIGGLEELPGILRDANRVLSEIKGSVEECDEKAREVEHLLQELDEELGKIDKEFKRVSLSIEEFKRVLLLAEKLSGRDKEVAVARVMEEIRGYERRIQRLSEDVSRYKEYLERLKKEFNNAKSMYSLEYINNIGNEVYRLRRELETTENTLENSHRELDSAIELLRQKVLQKIKPLKSTLSVISRLIKSVDDIGLRLRLGREADEVARTIKDLESVVNGVGAEVPGEIARMLGNAKYRLEELLHELRETIDSRVGRGASLILEKFISGALREEKLSRLVDKLSSETGLDRGQVIQILANLDEKGYIELIVEVRHRE